MFVARLVSAFSVLMVLGGSAAAQGTAWPAGTSLGGVGLTAPNGAECIVFPTGSSALITGNPAYINLPSTVGYGGLTYIPIDFLAGAPMITYVGAAQLIFDTPTTGRVKFDYYYTSASILGPKPPAPAVRFTGYEATVSGSPATLRLSVVFRIGGCHATLHAIYHQP